METKQFFKNQIDSVANMTTLERNTLLCKLAVKEHLNTIEPHEIIQLATIQAIRTANGEIDKVLKNWEENPELDPRR
jgi:methyltransferase-like protein